MDGDLFVAQALTFLLAGYETSARNIDFRPVRACIAPWDSAETEGGDPACDEQTRR